MAADEEDVCRNAEEVPLIPERTRRSGEKNSPREEDTVEPNRKDRFIYFSVEYAISIILVVLGWNHTSRRRDLVDVLADR